MTEAVALYLTSGIMIFGAAIGASLGIARLGASLIEGLGRQPTLLPLFRQQVFIMVGLIDAIPMIAVGMSLFILFALGPVETERASENGHEKPMQVIISPESRIAP